VHSKLVPLVHRKAKKLGLVSNYDSITNTVSVRVKGPGSVYAQLMASFLEGGDYFEENRDVMPLKTARVYCSMIKKETAQKMKAVQSGDSTVIFFNSKFPQKEILCEIKNQILVLQNGGHASEMQELKEFIENVHNYQVPEWKVLGFPSFKDYARKIAEEIKEKEEELEEVDVKSTPEFDDFSDAQEEF